MVSDRDGSHALTAKNRFVRLGVLVCDFRGLRMWVSCTVRPSFLGVSSSTYQLSHYYYRELVFVVPSIDCDRDPKAVTQPACPRMDMTGNDRPGNPPVLFTGTHCQGFLGLGWGICDREWFHFGFHSTSPFVHPMRILLSGTTTVVC